MCPWLNLLDCASEAEFGRDPASVLRALRGAGVAAFSVRATSSHPPTWPSRLPGRESRFQELFCQPIDEAADDIALRIASFNDLPCAGHSIGAVLFVRDRAGRPWRARLR